ncbi:hypothetical protein [Alteromonas flava]|uniref:hypothetical protein n=1 Tax=Alteromonas flava TaxID=2048003 RepID=UPI000C285721|nr:hypothetical protein [Alteromonas flava]
MEDKKKISTMSKVFAALLFLAALGHTSATLLPIIAGQEPSSPVSTRMFGFILWYGLFFMVIMSWKGKKRIVGFLTGAIIGFSVNFLLGVAVGYKNAEIRAIDTAVQESNAGLPIMIDDSTRLDRVAIDQKGKKYTYFISIVDLYASDIDISAMNDNFFNLTKPQSCTNEKLKVFFNEGYSVNYSYFDKDKKYIVAYSVTPEDCATL